MPRRITLALISAGAVAAAVVPAAASTGQQAANSATPGIACPVPRLITITNNSIIVRAGCDGGGVTIPLP